jgi:hypothetical protein
VGLETRNIRKACAKKKGAELFTFAKKPGCLNFKEHNVLFFLEIYFKIMLGLLKKILWT